MLRVRIRVRVKVRARVRIRVTVTVRVRIKSVLSSLVVLLNIEKEILSVLKYNMFLVGAKVFYKLSCALEHRKRYLERLKI